MPFLGAGTGNKTPLERRKQLASPTSRRVFFSLALVSCFPSSLSYCSVVVVFIFNYSFLRLLDIPWVALIARQVEFVLFKLLVRTFFSAALIRGCRDSTARPLPRSNCCFVSSWMLIFRGVCRSREISFFSLRYGLLRSLILFYCLLSTSCCSFSGI